ncbi:DNA-methyltransferase [Mycoplasma hafezii]|uniref:DNA-methyltransferase n=1 Tax=Mycoplasma hafezii TaxID=525886 RepID=UPI003CF6A05C
MRKLKECVIRNEDYLSFLSTITDKSIDLICVDPPYGKINGMMLSGQKKKIEWDYKMDWKKMFKEFNRVIKDGGTIVYFGQNPTYSEMILSNLNDFKYELIWVKNNSAQGFHSKRMPLGFTENIAVFIHNENKNSKRTFNNIAKSLDIDKNNHFTRWYAHQLLKYIGIPRRRIHEKLGHRKLEFFFCYTGKHFGLLSKKLYDELIEKYQIDKWKLFIPFDELKQIWKNERLRTKNVKLDSSLYSATLTNVLFVAKENKHWHPTQKPIELMEKLILMFSNEGDVVLDCFMGSGSTGVAALRNNRIFYGCDLDNMYFKISQERFFEIVYKS